MQRLLRGIGRSSNILPFLGLLGAVWLVLSRVVPQNQLAIITNGMFIAGWVGIVAAYLPVLFSKLRSPEQELEANLVFGILLIYTSIAASRMWSLGIILMGKPDWMINYPFQSLCYLLAAMSSFFILKVPGRSKVGWRYTTMTAIFTVMIVSLWLAYVEGH